MSAKIGGIFIGKGKKNEIITKTENGKAREMVICKDVQNVSLLSDWDRARIVASESGFVRLRFLKHTGEALSSLDDQWVYVKRYANVIAICFCQIYQG